MPSSVLFACGRNSIRSPMAEGLLKHFCGRRVYVDSVGIENGDIDYFAVQAMEEIGIDLSGHSPKCIGSYWDTSFDLLVCLSAESYSKARDLARTQAIEVEHWPTEDPSCTEGSREMRLDAYRQVRDDLRHRIERRFQF